MNHCIFHILSENELLKTFRYRVNELDHKSDNIIFDGEHIIKDMFLLHESYDNDYCSEEIYCEESSEPEYEQDLLYHLLNTDEYPTQGIEKREERIQNSFCYATDKSSEIDHTQYTSESFYALDHYF